MKQPLSRYAPECRRMILVGNYGSGKTEIAVNLAFELRSKGAAVSIADLDVVNPYFRCREDRNAMLKQGIRVVSPPGDRRFADLPIVLPEIKGMLQDDRPKAPYALFDVGGNDVGARVLSALGGHLEERLHNLLLVLNTNRPFTSTAEGCLQMMADIEKTSGLRITHLVANTHLMGDTTTDVIAEGYDIVGDVSRQSGVPIAFVAMGQAFVCRPELRHIDAPVLALFRRMTPPWLAPEARDMSNELNVLGAHGEIEG